MPEAITSEATPPLAPGDAFYLNLVAQIMQGLLASGHFTEDSLITDDPINRHKRRKEDIAGLHMTTDGSMVVEEAIYLADEMIDTVTFRKANGLCNPHPWISEL